MMEIYSQLFGKVKINKIIENEYEFSVDGFKPVICTEPKINSIIDSQKAMDIYLTRMLFGSCNSFEFACFLKNKQLEQENGN